MGVGFLMICRCSINMSQDLTRNSGGPGYPKKEFLQTGNDKYFLTDSQPEGARQRPEGNKVARGIRSDLAPISAVLKILRNTSGRVRLPWAEGKHPQIELAAQKELQFRLLLL